MTPFTPTRRALVTGLGASWLLSGTSRSLAAERRVLSLGGAITEILYRLGREGEIVGIDATSQFPPHAKASKPDVGYVRALSAEGLLSLRPTLVLATAGAGPPQVLALVADSGVPVVRISEEASERGVLERIRVVAGSVGADEEGAALAAEVGAGFADLARRRAALTRRKRALFVLSLQNGRPLVGGRGTTADGILALAGAENAAASISGWRPLSDEGLIAAAPDAVVTMTRGDGSPAPDVFALPAFSATPAARERSLVTMDGLYVLGFGPRTAQAAGDLMRALYA